MFLENIVFDAPAPREAGMFWQNLLGCEQLSDGADGFETRWAVAGGPVLDLCFPLVDGGGRSRQRLELALETAGGSEPGAAVEAHRQADPAGNIFTVPHLDHHAGLAGGAPLRLGLIQLESGDPQRDAQFWARFSGWEPEDAAHPAVLRHPTGQGPKLRLVAEDRAKQASEKNPMHLDLRLEPGDDPDKVAAEIDAAGGRELDPDWGQLPWRVFQDPSGNEFCVLPAARTAEAATG